MVKPHGLHGEVVVELVTTRTERTEPGARFVTDAGELRVAQSRPFQGRWLVYFEGVVDRAGAEALRGTVLRAPPLPGGEPGALWVHELVGATVVRAGDGATLGTVAAVVANPASDLLELRGGALVPVRFVVEHSPGRVVVDVPEGLVE